MSTSQDLKSAGLKATLPRLKIINLFESSKVRHLTAEDVYRLLLAEGLDIGLATVYRVLTQFEQAGLLVRHHFESGKAVFELNQGTHHDHLVCMQCGRVEEFYDAEIEKRQNEVATRTRLRDQRARALPLRRLHQDALPASQVAAQRNSAPAFWRRQAKAPSSTRRFALGVASAFPPGEIAEPESQQVQRREIGGRAGRDDASEPADARPQRRAPATTPAGRSAHTAAPPARPARPAACTGTGTSRAAAGRRRPCAGTRTAARHSGTRPMLVASVSPAWPMRHIRISASVCATKTVTNAIRTGVLMFCRA